MVNWGILDVKGIDSLCNVQSHLKFLLICQHNIFLLVEQIEQGSSKTKFCQYKHESPLNVHASSHEVDKVAVIYLPQCGNFSLEFLGQVQLIPRCWIVSQESQLLYCDIYLLVCPLIDFSTCSGSNLLLKENICYIYPEMLLVLLEFLLENVLSNLSMTFLFIWV